MVLPMLLRRLAVLSLCSLSSALSTTFSNSKIYQFDTDGNAIDSTSGKIDILGGSYLWYGINFGCGSDFCGISSWSSSDLVSWKANGYLFDPNTTEFTTLCALPGNCGRPHIIYNKASQKYVLWVNAGAPGFPVLTSSSPSGPYTLQAERASIGYQPPGSQAGDFSLAVINGTGYLAYSSIDFTTLGASIWPPFLQSIYVQQLTPDFLNTTGAAYHIRPAGDLVDMQAESPDIFKRGDYYYVTASNTCGFCTGTLLIVYRSKSFMGPWTRQIISGDSCGAQTTGVLTIPSSNGSPPTYLSQVDVFSSTPLTGSRTAAHGHRFQTLAFNNDGSVRDLNCNANAKDTVDIVAGNVTVTSQSITDGSSLSADYFVSCELPKNNLYQTWSSSKTGTLQEVGINIAGNTPTANITLTVFRYSNNTNFFTPRYVWETLATTNIVPSNLSESLLIAKVPVGKAVSKGDKLGIAITSLGTTTVCVLKTVSENVMWSQAATTRTLFANGINQVSFRGADGTTPPVKVQEGMEIKWYAKVV